MKITLAKQSDWCSVSLWFEIPYELQDSVIPLLTSKLPALQNEHLRELYVRALDSVIIAQEKYSDELYCTGGYTFYALYGTWRIGTRDIQGEDMDAIKASILDELTAFSKAFEIEC
jgi:hypothetical protein